LSETKVNLPTLHTARLILRTPELGDLERWAQMMADAETCKYLGGVQPRSMVWRVIMSMVGAWHVTGVSMFSVIEKSTNKWVGRIGPWHPEGWPGDEIGWALHPDALGQGYATEAAIACMDYAVEQLGWHEIIHTIDPQNVASINVAQRLGSALRGPGKLPPPHEHALVQIWGQTAANWRARQRVEND
jgi:RimJ/RimL family protein N-acetyltransferase